jgi:prevent-host-death family protein
MLAVLELGVYTLECAQEVLMEITTKELRIQPGKIIDQVVNGQEVTVTYRGEALVKIVSLKEQDSAQEGESVFGLWKDHDQPESVEDYVRNMRKGRQF